MTTDLDEVACDARALDHLADGVQRMAQHARRVPLVGTIIGPRPEVFRELAELLREISRRMARREIDRAIARAKAAAIERAAARDARPDLKVIPGDQQ